MNVEGKWDTVRAEYAGEEAPELVVRQTEVEFTAGRYAVKFAGKIVDSGSYELTPGSEGGMILVLHGEHGTNAGKTIPSLIQSRGSLLRICYGLTGLTPQAFSTEKSSGSYLATYRRQ